MPAIPSTAATLVQVARAYAVLQNSEAAGAAIPSWARCLHAGATQYGRRLSGGHAGDTRAASTATTGDFHGGAAADRLPF